jgi:hypothetical protein
LCAPDWWAPDSTIEPKKPRASRVRPGPRITPAGTGSAAAHHGRRQQLDARFVPAFAGIDVLQTAHQAHVRLTPYQVLLADLPARVVDQPNCAAQDGRQVANEVRVKRIGVLTTVMKTQSKGSTVGGMIEPDGRRGAKANYSTLSRSYAMKVQTLL